jgi:hypothetical protein
MCSTRSANDGAVCSRMSRVGRSGFSTRCNIVTVAIAPISAQFWCCVVKGTGRRPEYFTSSIPTMRISSGTRIPWLTEACHNSCCGEVIGADTCFWPAISEHLLDEAGIVRVATAYEILLMRNSVGKQSYRVAGNSCQNGIGRQRLCYKGDPFHSIKEQMLLFMQSPLCEL